MTPPYPIRRNSAVLLDTLAVAGKTVVDVGSGDGANARLMAQAGATVIGLECQPRQLAKARAAAPVPGITYLDAGAEAMPLADSLADIVVFFNSLHHVAPSQMDRALAEAARVLKPGGTVFVSEPLAEGDFFEMVRPIEDETQVRAQAYAAMRAAHHHGLTMAAESVHRNPVLFKDFAAWRDRVASANPEREAIFDSMDRALRDSFERLGRRTPDGIAFEQPTRVNILRKDRG
ncbi:MAG: class I SAM-dependent methyltransferase [Rhodospirillales bacterium]|nr:class I SAM-dependent methyltransferase [Rhodospirillales bacterium]